MVQMSEAEFEDVVARALDEIPERFVEHMDNLVFLIQDEPDPDQGPPDTLGLYEGIALTDGDFGPFAEPNRIFIFRGPLLRMCESVEEVEDEVLITVFHEVAHHFGIDDDELWDLGWA
ncbi:MAG: metallopeptidase family protein [Actinomycetaceae bacterium]|nr:metallopeptidase family protein [Actinomycetaceae bacterium]